MYFFLFCSNKKIIKIGPEMGVFSNLETFEAVREISRNQCSARAAVKFTEAILDILRFSDGFLSPKLLLPAKF
jgi:hypothetical protein